METVKPAASGRDGVRSMIEVFQEVPIGTDIEIRPARDLSGHPAMGIVIGDQWFAFYLDEARALIYGIEQMIGDYPDQAKNFGPLVSAMKDALAIMEGPIQ